MCHLGIRAGEIIAQISPPPEDLDKGVTAVKILENESIRNRQYRVTYLDNKVIHVFPIHDLYDTFIIIFYNRTRNTFAIAAYVNYTSTYNVYNVCLRALHNMD